MTLSYLEDQFYCLNPCWLL